MPALFHKRPEAAFSLRDGANPAGRAEDAPKGPACAAPARANETRHAR